MVYRPINCPILKKFQGFSKQPPRGLDERWFLDIHGNDRLGSNVMSFHSAHPPHNDSYEHFEYPGDLFDDINNDRRSDENRRDECSSTSVDRRGGCNLSIPDEETQFELVSAYLDDEVSAEERQLVAQWLRDDPRIRRMYQQLLMLRQAIRTAPVPEQPVVQVPDESTLWTRSATGTVRWTLICVTAIALLGGLSQLGSAQGQNHLQQVWQFIRCIPEGTWLELASDKTSPATERPKQNLLNF